MAKKSLDIIGPYPPPFGGISVHIYRIEQILRQKKIDYLVYNHGFYSGHNIVATKKSSLWYFKYFFSRNKAQLIHFHHFFALHYLYFFFLSIFSKSKLLVTIHGEEILYYSRFKQRLVIFFIRNTKFAELISVSGKLSVFLSQKGVNNRLLPAYVPATDVSFKQLKKIDEKNYFLYSIWQVNRQTAESIYNMELAFELLAQIRENYHLLLLIGSKRDVDMSYLTFLMDKYQVSDSLTILFEKQLTDYISNCKFLVRTNNVDGYGVSLQEALDLGIPAIASDVCIRPKGTILFKRGNIDDLYEKVINIEKYWSKGSIETPDYHIQLLEIYKKYLL